VWRRRNEEDIVLPYIHTDTVSYIRIRTRYIQIHAYT
jgi:hypothetical protein